ncbi:MAG: alpha/beta hydrolase [Deltaproteobacteria bacterium]|nr:MAG: alpha/beta hydrolase [Deltaproteobacteria bacterium]
MTVLPTKVFGAGDDTVVLLHGFLGSGRNLWSLAKALARRRSDLRVVVPTLRGHIGAPPLAPGGTLESMAADVVRLGEQAGARAIVGHSLGGRVAIVAAVDHRVPVWLLDISPGPVVAEDTEAVLDALLAAPAAAASRAEMGRALEAAGAPGPIVPWLCMNLVRDEGGVRWGIDRARLAAFHRTESGRNLWPYVEGRGVDIAGCVRGGASNFVCAQEAERLEGVGARVVTIPKAGHFVHVDALDAVAEVLSSGLLRGRANPG